MQKRLTHLALSDDGFLFDTVTGNTFTLNSSATFLLRRLIDGMDLEEIVEELCGAYDTGKEIAMHDADQFVQYLCDLEILHTEKVRVQGS